jgi:hypothetical protein
MRTQALFTSSLLIACGLLPAYAIDYTSAAPGNWDTTTTWNPAGNPQTGTTDNVVIGAGHTVLWNNTNVGLAGSGDLGTSGGHSITINGGIFAQVPVGNWMRIGQGDSGSFNIKDGAFYFTDGTGTTGNNPSLQIGIGGGTGTMLVGDGVGDLNSAIVDLRNTTQLVDGLPVENAVGVQLNIGSDGLGAGGGVGHVIVNSDGILTTDIRTPGGASDPKTRIGQAPTLLGQSTLLVNNGQFTANGSVEIASDPPADTARSNGLLTIDGDQAYMDQNNGVLQVGLNGDGVMFVQNGGHYTKFNDANNRLDVFVGTDTGSTGSLTIQSGGLFTMATGGDVGDLRVGYNGAGVMNVTGENSLYHRDAGNWDWIGQGSTGNGTLNVTAGGTFETTGGSNMIVGLDAGSIGLVKVDGGTVNLQNTGAAGVRLGQNGNGTYRQVSGSTTVSGFQLAENDGTGLLELQGGDMTVRSFVFVGGAGTGSTGAGTGTFNQSGGDLTVTGSISIGLATGHTGIYNLTGGTVSHTASDVSVGESGTGSMTIGTSASFADTSDTGVFFVGRNNGSAGTLIVDGSLSRTSATTQIRVGNGDAGGVENSNGTGILGGKGTITTATPIGVMIGSHGTLTGGTMTTVGTLAVQGNLAFTAGGTLNANFDGSGNVDRINVAGTVNINGAVLTGQWTGGTSPVGASSRYWLIVNDGTDAITGTFANTVATSPNSAQAPGANAFITLGSQEFAIYYGADQATNALTGGNDLLLVALGTATSPTNDQILKAVLGTNAAGGPNLPVATRSGTNLVFTYNLVQASTTSYTATVEYSATLAPGSWTTATAGMTVVTGTGATRTVTVTIPTGAGGAPRYFARLVINPAS